MPRNLQLSNLTQKSHFSGQFNGIIGMVERGEADLSAALLVINDERARDVNFSIPVSLEY